MTVTATTTSLAVSPDLVSGMEWGPSQMRQVIHLAADVKARPDRYRGALGGRFLAMIFEKPSLRTRVTFEVGISSLGGTAIFLDHKGTKLGEREAIRDVAKNLERMVHGIVARVHSQASLEELARHAQIPVINALTDRYHPCQAISDFFTLQERFGSTRGLKVAYVGDGNNVCHSLITLATRVGAHLRIATPAGYEPDPRVIAEGRQAARETKAKIEVMRSPEEAVVGAQAVYTDVWASMGQEEEAEARAAIFAPYQVNAALMAHAAPDAVFMHCLPAHRGSEVTDAVIDAPNSIAIDQAENRLHAQKAILLTLLA